MQEELQQIIDCLDTSIPETIRILPSAEGGARLPAPPMEILLLPSLGQAPCEGSCLHLTPLQGATRKHQSHHRAPGQKKGTRYRRC